MKPIIFLFPVIALTLVGILYFYLLKRTTCKKTFKRFALALFFIAFLLNLVWELVQMPLYDATSFTVNHIAFCALGAVADAIMFVLLYFGFSAIVKNVFWIQHPKWYHVVLVILIGGTGAILSEIRHLSLGSWAYSDVMPIIPVVNVGLSPVLQFMILPMVIAILSYRTLKI